LQSSRESREGKKFFNFAKNGISGNTAPQREKTAQIAQIHLISEKRG